MLLFASTLHVMLHEGPVLLLTAHNVMLSHVVKHLNNVMLSHVVKQLSTCCIVP